MKNRIKELLQDKQVKATDLAEKVGISKVSMYNILNNKQEPSANTLNSIAEKLDVPFWYLFTDPEEVLKKQELTALIRFRGQLYQADTIEELKDVVKMIERIPFN